MIARVSMAGADTALPPASVSAAKPRTIAGTRQQLEAPSQLFHPKGRAAGIVQLIQTAANVLASVPSSSAASCASFRNAQRPRAPKTTRLPAGPASRPGWRLAAAPRAACGGLRNKCAKGPIEPTRRAPSSRPARGWRGPIPHAGSAVEGWSSAGATHTGVLGYDGNSRAIRLSQLHGSSYRTPVVQGRLAASIWQPGGSRVRSTQLPISPAIPPVSAPVPKSVWRPFPAAA